MTAPRISIYSWVQKKGYFLFPLLAFAIPLMVRVIPELIMGQYLVGFDTIAYYVPNALTWLKNGADFWWILSSAPLLYSFLIAITSIGAPIIMTLKVLGPLLLGTLGFAIYYYANRALLWSPKKSLAVAILSTLYFVALRISWDMLRSELALIFLFLALVSLHKGSGSIKNSLFLLVAMVLVVLCHQLVAIILFGIVIAAIASLTLKHNKTSARIIILCSVPAAFLLLVIFYLNYFVFSSPLLGYSVSFAGGFEALTGMSQLELIADTIGFVVFCYLPLLPLLLFGVRAKKNLQLRSWMVFLLVLVALAIVIPNAFFLGGILPYRWILLLTYPISFVAVEGLSRIKWRWYKVAVGIIVALLSVTFMVLPNSHPFVYYDNYSTYIPRTMMQNTLPLIDCQSTTNALAWAKSNLPSNASLLVHEAFYGWASLTFDFNRLIPYFFSSPTDAISALPQNMTHSLYLIWWVNGTGWYGQPNVPSSFQEVYHSGNIAIYHYSVT